MDIKMSGNHPLSNQSLPINLSLKISLLIRISDLKRYKMGSTQFVSCTHTHYVSIIYWFTAFIAACLRNPTASHCKSKATPEHSDIITFLVCALLARNITNFRINSIIAGPKKNQQQLVEPAVNLNQFSHLHAYAWVCQGTVAHLKVIKYAINVVSRSAATQSIR